MEAGHSVMCSIWGKRLGRRTHGADERDLHMVNWLSAIVDRVPGERRVKSESGSAGRLAQDSPEVDLAFLELPRELTALALATHDDLAARRFERDGDCPGLGAFGPVRRKPVSGPSQPGLRRLTHSTVTATLTVDRSSETTESTRTSAIRDENDSR